MSAAVGRAGTASLPVNQASIAITAYTAAAAGKGRSMSFVERSGRSSWRVRYWRDDGTHGSIPGFPAKKAAEAKAREIDSDRSRGDFIDPDAGTLSLADWTLTWFDALDV